MEKMIIHDDLCDALEYLNELQEYFGRLLQSPSRVRRYSLKKIPD